MYLFGVSLTLDRWKQTRIPRLSVKVVVFRINGRPRFEYTVTTTYPYIHMIPCLPGSLGLNFLTLAQPFLLSTYDRGSNVECLNGSVRSLYNKYSFV